MDDFEKRVQRVALRMAMGGVGGRKRTPLERRQEEMRVLNLTRKAGVKRKKELRIQRVEDAVDLHIAGADEIQVVPHIELRPDVIFGSGVYVYMKGSQIVYIGATGRGLERSLAHGKSVGSLGRMSDRLHFFLVPSRKVALDVEACLIVKLKPLINKTLPRNVSLLSDESRNIAAQVIEIIKRRGC